MRNKKLFLIPVLFLLIVSSVLAVAVAPDSADTVAYWKMEDLTDEVGSNDLINTGGATSGATGIIDDCYSFETNDYMTGFDLSSAIDGVISISAWIYPTGNGQFFSHRISDGTEQFVGYVDGTNFGYYLKSNGNDVLVSSTLTLNNWYHIVVTLDASDNIKLYKDGSLVDSDTLADFSWASTQAFRLGSRPDNSNYFNGLIDEVTIFDVALTSDNAEYLYNSGSPGIAQQYDFPQPDAANFLDITNTNSINNMSFISNIVNVSTTNGTIHTGLNETSYPLINFTLSSDEGYYFNKTYINYNTSNDLSYTFIEYPRVTVKNKYNSSYLEGFNVLYDSVNISDVSGTAFIPLNESKTITISKGGYFDKEVTHNFVDSNDTEIEIFQSVINVSVKEMITNNSVSNWELYSNDTKIAESTSSSVIKYFNAGTYTDLTLKSKDSSFTNRSVDDFTINSLDNKTVTFNIFLSDLNVSAVNAVTSNPIMNFTVSVDNYNNSDTRNFSTTTGNLLIPIHLNDYYNITIDAPGYALYDYTEDVLINESPKNIQFSLYTNNSISFTVKDESSNALITDLITITLTGTNISYAFNSTTGNKYVDSIQDGEYSVKAEGALYNAKYYAVTVAERSHQKLTMYLSTNYTEGIFTIIEKGTGEYIQNALFSMSRTINGSWSIVSTKYSDITGRIPFNYLPNTPYKFSISKTGYTSREFILDPVLFEEYDIELTADAEDISYSDVAVIYNPFIYVSGNNDFRFNIYSPNGLLNEYWVNVSYPGGSTYRSGSESIGEEFSFNFSIINPAFYDLVNVKYHYETVLGNNVTINDPYAIMIENVTGTFMQNYNNDFGLGLLEKVLIVSLAALIISVFAFTVGGFVAALFFGLSVFVVGVIMGFLPLWLIIIPLIVSVILMVGRSA